MRTLRASHDMSRRTVMRGALATAGFAAVDVSLGQSASAAGRPAVMARSTPHDARVVVVGAGLAGLTAAYRLARQGVHVQVFEARDDRVGGRCWTARGFAGGQLAEHGGERIDTRHTHIRKLAGELGLRLEEDNPGRRHGERGVLSLQGAVRDQAVVSKDMDLVEKRLRADARRIGSYVADRASRAARDFDQLSVRDWLQANVPGGMSLLLGSRLACGVGTFYGSDAADLSAINLIEQFLGPAGADEKYHVEGGNDLILRGLAARLPEPALHFGAPLLAVRRTGDTYRLRFGGVRREVIADRVVLALPFTTLRRVDLDDSGLGARKREAIDNHGMGTDAKVLLQFDRQFHRFGDFSGRITSDDPQLTSWDTSAYQTGAEGLLTLFVGGWSGSSYPTATAHGKLSAAVTRTALGRLDALVPGLKSAYNGHGRLDSWVDDPWARGSYASYRPGQFTKYWGWTGRSEGRLHFAGEHTSTHSQGYLNGAVESGERVAREVLTALGRA
ncbi:flavin monoamine oxidase family protein [Streptomyces acidiscabies]|uniref:FAD-dependent oxidoreductase n=1 Tax=Streptomyces acidiscabies TaxID=42234 RepID=A0AAP6EK61_9ACTN|nr:FAD-dependent oxidoreductase [Streptomyces acidiscabies]MBZ3913780.1 FAD-dependent oxidoreductase [Streptomyces acidiscabies]MDX2965255.1 FAD-dependent oxidoreductase [Streptomyces acidiscabies]MDX3022129.1 FAD-dependent oxidoreductase [Streptomyces acidiscabies]MDX3795392.1 FAD-dependent oxidoreductase [Streptomyces acidiscabies]